MKKLEKAGVIKDGGRMIKKTLTAVFLCIGVVVGMNGGVRAEEANRVTKTQLSKAADKEEANLQQLAQELGASYHASTRTIKLKSNITLTSGVLLETSKSLTIDMNGKKISGGSIRIDNSSKATIVITGKGAFKDCGITKYGAGKLSLEGDIVYKNEKERALRLVEGTTVIRAGRFYGKETSILWSDFDWECGDSCLYIKGGTFHGDIELSNNVTYLYDGTIGGKINMYSGSLYMKGGTVKKGIVTSYNDEQVSEIYISGGKILDQILLDSSYGGKLEISGGSIQSGKSAVIQSNVLETEEYSYSKIKVKGGTLISTRENGYGIKAVNSEITVEGGIIKNTTKKGKTAIQSVRYTAKRKDAQIKDTTKVSIKGFGEQLENTYKKNYCGKNISYQLDENGTLTISGSGDMFSSMHFEGKDDGKFNNVENVVVEEGITSVDGFAFLSKLKSVSLPSSLKRIGFDAFSDCRALETVTMKEGLETIEACAFFCNNSLKEIYIPDTVTKIGQQAFDGCTSAKTVHISKNLKELPELMFNKCTSLESAEIPDGVKVLPYGTFYGCKGLSNVKLPAKLETIEATAFIGCIKLKEIEIPSTVKEIGRAAFKNCKRLDKVKMELSKDAVINKSAFENTPFGETLK